MSWLGDVFDDVGDFVSSAYNKAEDSVSDFWKSNNSLEDLENTAKSAYGAFLVATGSAINFLTFNSGLGDKLEKQGQKIAGNTYKDRYPTEDKSAEYEAQLKALREQNEKIKYANLVQKQRNANESDAQNLFEDYQSGDSVRSKYPTIMDYVVRNRPEEQKNVNRYVNKQ
jgi:hypothetical protein